MGPVERVGDGVYRVEVDGKMELVYVAGPPHDRWVFWNGQVFRGDFGPAKAGRHVQTGPSKQSLTAPMPATVVAIHVHPGDRVTRGQVVMLLEAMKMELPVRAPGDSVVSAVHCATGDLVQADAVLLELDA
jgi:biotin carboxyl carrier protein